MSKGRLEDIQKIIDEHYIIYYRPGDFATGVYRNEKKKKRRNRRIRSKQDFSSACSKKHAHRGS